VSTRFEGTRFEREGLSFDDVLLRPRKSDVLPREVDVSTRLTRGIRLNIPILSAAMDRVTDARMAIAMAREGGIGIIHKNMPIEQQAREVDRVKRSESGMIIDPITIEPDAVVRDALEIMSQYHISGLPITQGDRLVGILTNRDLRFETRLDRPVRDLMTRENLVTCPPGTTLEQAKVVLHQHRIEKLPVVDEENRLVGLITIKDIEKVARYPEACKDELGRLRCGAAIGVAADTDERVAALLVEGCDVLVLDTAHSDSDGALAMVEHVRSNHPEAQLIVGNVGTRDGALHVIQAGADAIKVGMGPGATCTTRVVSGAGAPQISAIAECAELAAEQGVPVIADGGIKYSGDVTKAIAAGADCVMLGALLAGTEDSPGETVLYMGRTYKEYRGMGSVGAMKESSGSKDRYLQDHVETETKLVPEGLEGRVPFKGPLSGVIHQLIGGLRAGMGYCGVRNIEELKTQTEFYRITAATLRESHPHDIIITEEAPNYQRGTWPADI